MVHYDKNEDDENTSINQEIENIQTPIKSKKLNNLRDKLEIENNDKKEDTQRKMAWIALIFIIIYAFLPLLPFIPESKIKLLASFSDVYFISLASIIGMFFGTKAYLTGITTRNRN